MTKAHEGAACAVLLVIATSLHAGERFVTVTAPDGLRDSTATVTCADPVSAAAAVDASGRAALPDACRSVRCESDRWLPGATAMDVSGSVTCTLRPAVKLAIDLPQDAGGALVVSVYRQDEKTPDFQIVSTSSPTEPRPPIAFPPLPAGPYRLSAARPDGSWTCRTAARLASPARVSLFVPWRDPVIVEGRVAAGDGRPLAGVPVLAVVDGPHQREVEDWRCGAGPGPDVRSGLDGTFGIAVDPRVATLIAAGGWADPHGIAFVSRRGPRAGPLAFTPAVPHRVSARVLDEEDRPVGCRIRLAIDDPDERWAARALPDGPKEAACVADGRVDVGPFRADAYQLDLRSDEALPLRIPGSIAPGAAAEDLGIIRVERGASLRVSVNDDTHAPVANAKVAVASGEGFVLERSAITGADGAAQLHGLVADAPVRIVVEAAGFSRSTRENIAPGGALEITLGRIGAVQGTVTVAGGAAIRARVTATAPDGHATGAVDTDEAGSFTLSSLPKGVALLRASAEGFRSSEAVRVVVDAEGAIEPVVLMLRDATRFRGTVVDSNRAPIPGAAVMIVSRGLLEDPPESGALAATRAARDGTFGLDGADSADETLVALAPGFASASVRAAAIAERSDIELVLRPEARLLARLPRSLPGDAAMIVSDMSGVIRLIPVRGRREVVVDGLADGDARVALRTGQSRAVRLIAGETAAVDLSAGARVRGHVRQAGRPQARAAVTIAEVRSGSISTGVGVVTAADGAFALDGISPGDYLLVALTPRGRAERRVVVPNDGELDADLDIAERGVRVTARSGTDGSPVSSARVTLVPGGGRCTAFATASEVTDGQGWNVSVSDGGCARGSSGSDGSVSLVAPGSGPHVVSVEAAGFAPWSGTVDIVDGVTELVADLKRGGPPLVRVSIETDPPGVAGSIYCVQAGHSASHGPVSGEATCEGLAKGPAVVAFRSPDFGVGRAAVDVPESGETTVTLRVERGGLLVAPLEAGSGSSVEVVDDRGVVWNRPYGFGWPRCGLEARGSTPAYACHEVPPGTYTVVVDGRRRAAIVVRGGETSVAY